MSFVSRTTQLILAICVHIAMPAPHSICTLLLLARLELMRTTLSGLQWRVSFHMDGQHHLFPVPEHPFPTLRPAVELRLFPMQLAS